MKPYLLCALVIASPLMLLDPATPGEPPHYADITYPYELNFHPDAVELVPGRHGMAIQVWQPAKK